MNVPQITLAAGFKDTPRQSAWTFRAILQAMSRPGRIEPLTLDLDPPSPLHPATAAAALTLIDQDTPVWLDPASRQAEVISFLRFHCGCPLVEEPGGATFAIAADPAYLAPLESFTTGTPEYPDRSATLIVQCASLSNRSDITLTGPGIETEQGLSIPSLSLEFWHQLKDSNAHYPLGLDVIFTSGSAVAACPRSVALEIPEAA